MLKAGLLASVCALGLIATPVMAAGTTHTTHRAHSAKMTSSASSHDNMADQLNAKSLAAAQQGRPFNAGGNPGMGGTSKP
jgi:hypothetical protein